MAAVPSIRPAPLVPSQSADETSELYERFHRQIFSFCLRELGNREEAEDATQSTFLNAFRALENGTVFEHESAWLYQAAHHVCQTRRRSWYRRRRVESDGDFDRLQHVLASPATDADELFGLRPALESLPDQQRKALLLREWQGLSYAEIATELELSQSAVETLLFRARRGLAERLVDEPSEVARRKAGRTGDFGSLGAAIKALVFGGGVKVAATLATVAATTVVASAPSVRDDVVHFVAPSLPAAASPVRHAAHAAKRVVARHQSSVPSTPAAAAPAVVQAAPPRAVHQPKPRAHTVRKAHAVVHHAVKTARAVTPPRTPKPAASSAPLTSPAPVPPAPAPAESSTTTATTTTAQTTTTAPATTATTPSVPRGDPGRHGEGIGSLVSPAAAALPTLTSFSPSSGLAGTVVVVSGGPFKGVTGVAFNGVPAASFSAGAVLVAKVPQGATSGPIAVTTSAGTATSAGSFTVVTPSAPVLTPSVAGFSPRNGGVGATVVILGAHLSGATAVAFNGVAASFSSRSDAQLTAVVPAGATTGPITVTTPQGTATAGTFAVSAPSPPAASFPSLHGPLSMTTPAAPTPPSLSALSPGTAVAGTTVTVAGAHFTGATAVAVNGTAASFTVVSDSELTIVVPAGATTGAVSVTTPAGTAVSSSPLAIAAAPASPAPGSSAPGSPAPASPSFPLPPAHLDSTGTLPRGHFGFSH